VSERVRNPALDTIRATAITLVLVAHLLPTAHGNPQLLAQINTLAQRGVDLFFVLSGYLIGGIAVSELATTGKLSVRRFWQRRWMRTLPAYYATLALYALKELLPHRSQGLISPVAYVFFVQSYVIGTLADFAHSWSLCVEEHFYLALPLVLLVLAALRLTRVRHVATAVSVIALGFAAYRYLHLDQVDERLTHFRTDGLSVGVLLACAQAGRPELLAVIRRHAGVLTAVAVVAVVVAGAVNVAGSAVWQSAFALALGVWVALAAARLPFLDVAGSARPVAFVAKISYSLYLLHPLVSGALEQIYFRRHAETWGSYVAWVVLSITGSVIAAALSYRFIERRFLAWRDRSVPHRRAPAAT